MYRFIDPERETEYYYDIMISGERTVKFNTQDHTRSYTVERRSNPDTDTASLVLLEQSDSDQYALARAKVEKHTEGVYEFNVEEQPVFSDVAMLASAAFLAESIGVRTPSTVFALSSRVNPSLSQTLATSLEFRPSGKYTHDGEEILLGGSIQEVSGHANAYIRRKNVYRNKPTIRPSHSLSSYVIRQLTASDGFEMPIQMMFPHDLTRAAGRGDVDITDVIADTSFRDRIHKRLSETPDFRGAVELEGRLVGFSQAGDWLPGDQAPYTLNGVERAALRLNKLFSGGRLWDNPLGIFAVNVLPMLSAHEQLDVADMLLSDVVNARGKGHDIVRVGLAKDEPLLPVFQDHGFQATGRYGQPTAAPHSLQLYDKPLK